MTGPAAMRTGETISFEVRNVLNPPPPPKFNVGDVLTFDGSFRRRTFWQWLTRQPKELQRFIVTSECSPMPDGREAFTIQPESDR